MYRAQNLAASQATAMYRAQNLAASQATPMYLAQNLAASQVTAMYRAQNVQIMFVYRNTHFCFRVHQHPFNNIAL
jgi:hypothetical protein